MERVIAMYQKLCSIHCGVFHAKKKMFMSKVGQVMKTSLGDLHTVPVRMRTQELYGLIRKHIENMADKSRKVFQMSKIWL